MRPVQLMSLAILGAACLGISACDNSSNSAASTPISSSGNSDSASIMVASDLHYFSPSLMTDTGSAALKAYLQEDRKMLLQSPELLHAFLDSVRARRPGILLLTGDLTKDGEAQSHQDMADSLAKLRGMGIKIYVIPGNHDVMNPESQQYASDAATAADNVSSTTFAKIYADCGFNQAIARDTASLSYVVEPVSGVWILALDACRWKDNVPGGTETVGGRYLPQTVTWIKAQLDSAKAKGKTVVGMMHHGILEHFTGEATNTLSKDYVVAGHDSLAQMFAQKGLHVMFTGHFHANDIAQKVFGTDTLTDIETGSLVTAPSPFRYGTLGYNTLSVNTSLIRSVPAGTPGVTGDFQTWSHNFLISGMSAMATYQFINTYKLDTANATTLGVVVANAYAAHYAGNESGVPSTVAPVITKLNAMGDIGVYFASTITALFTDLAPADDKGIFGLR